MTARPKKLDVWVNAETAKLDHADCVAENEEVTHTWEAHWTGDGPRGETPRYMVDPESELEKRAAYGDK